MKSLLRSPFRTPIITTVLIVVLLVALSLGRQVHASSVVAPEVAVAAATGPVNIEVQMDFTPEAFNVSFLQQYANAVSVQENSAMLFGVSADGISTISQQFWVNRIQLIGTP